MGTPSRRVLVLYWHPGPGDIRAAIRHHLRALDYGAGRPQVLYENTVDGASSLLRTLAFDAIILHTTFLCMRWTPWFHVWKWKTRWLRDVDCVKIALPQDEYDHSEILDEWLAELGVSVIFTNFDEAKRRTLYPIMSERASFRRAFTGYIDEQTATRLQGRLRSTGDRRWDIVYRATHLPYWFGSHGQLKHRIADIVSTRARAHDLTCDISTRGEDTIVGEQWFDFLASGRVVIGCESGSSVLDRRGEIQARIRRILRDEPDTSFDAVSHQLPPGWNDYQFFAISPRHFEAVITRTCQVLVEGHYDGILEPDRHYIPLRRDFSNLDEVLEKVRDRRLVEEVATRAYREIHLAGRYTYRTLAGELEAVLDELRYRPPLMNRIGGSVCWRVGTGGRRFLAAVRGVSSGPRSIVHASALGLVAIRLAVTSRSLRRLVRAYLASREARAAVRPGALFADLLRLGIMLKVRAGTLVTRKGFGVDLGLDEPAGRLVLRSRPIGSTVQKISAGQASDPAATEDAMRRGLVRDIVWDHSAVGVSVSCRVTPVDWLDVDVGERGVHRFGALSALVTRLPARTADALLAVQPPQRRISSLLGRIRVDARTYAALGLVIGREIVRTSALRGLVLAWLGRRELRRAAGGARLLPDLLRLVMARGRLAGDGAIGAPFRVDLSYCAEEATVLFQSVTVAEDAVVSVRPPGVGSSTRGSARGPAGPIRGIVWDHSAVGTSVPCLVLPSRSLSITVGPLGRYRFAALETLARRYPRQVWAALAPREIPTTDATPGGTPAP
jgi:hypothetical protein